MTRIVAAFFLALASIIWAQEPGEVIATRFVLIDDQSKERAILEMMPMGPSLVLFDDQGMARINLSIFFGMSAPQIADAHGTPRIMLSVVKDMAAIQLVNESGELRLSMSEANDGVTMSMANKEGNLLLSMAVFEKEGHGLMIWDEQGTERIMLSIEEGKSQFSVYDAQGKQIWGSPQ